MKSANLLFFFLIMDLRRDYSVICITFVAYWHKTLLFCQTRKTSLKLDCTGWLFLICSFETTSALINLTLVSQSGFQTFQSLALDCHSKQAFVNPKCLFCVALTQNTSRQADSGWWLYILLGYLCSLKWNILTKYLQANRKQWAKA